MSDTNPAKPAASPKSKPAAADTPAPAAGGAAAPGTNPAQEAFGRYRTRVAALPMATGWPMPPSAATPGWMQGGAPGGGSHPMGSLSQRLGGTVRLSVDLLNATLMGAANMLGGIAAERGGYGGDCGCGCHDDRCGHDCCREMGVGCCRPGVNGCGCDGSCGCGCGHA